MEKTQWYKDAIIYQIYPRSFCDSNGDGIGDLKGITSKLDYIASLGVNAVWLSPCYKSPNDDNGYDISDYRDIMTEFGTLDDWKEMTGEMHKRGIRLIMDLVVNHSSDEHEWFRESRKSKDNPYRDYYIWQKGKGDDGKKPPNNWTSRFGGSAWEFDETTNEWYLHLFTKKQPDLNWDNPKVRKEVEDIARYWLDLGCDGFRCDVITYISKASGYPQGKSRLFLKGDEHFTHGPNVHTYLNELNQNVFSEYDCMTVGEAAGVTVEQGLLYTGEGRNELDTVFTFEHVETDLLAKIFPVKFKLNKLKKVIERWQTGMHNKGWNSLYYENHDQPRSVPRFTGNPKGNLDKAAKMLAVSIFFKQGTPYIYQGQELGIPHYKFKNLADQKDVLVDNYLKKSNFLTKPLLKYVFNRRGRGASRMPMQWDDSQNAGFTSGKPWMMINPCYKTINAAAQDGKQDSVLNFYRELINLRKISKTVRNGSFKLHLERDKNILCYERINNHEKMLVVCNFTNKNASCTLPDNSYLLDGSLIITNYGTPPNMVKGKLRPYEAFVYYKNQLK